MGNYNKGETERDIAALSMRQDRLGRVDLHANAEVTAATIEEKHKQIRGIITNIQLQADKLDAAYTTSLAQNFMGLFTRLSDIRSTEKPNEKQKNRNEQHEKLLRLQRDAEALLAEVEQQRQLASPDTGMTNAARSLYGGAMTLIGNDDSDKRKADLDLLKQQLDQAALIANKDERTKQVAFLEATMRKLFSEIAAEKIGPKIEVTRENKDSPQVQAQDANKKVVEKAYEKALKERFGIMIEIPDNFKNTSLDKVYAMFDKVPVDHVVHTSLKNFKFSLQQLAGTGKFETSSIVMVPDTGKDAGKFAELDFSSVTLHEIGHSVDDRFKITAKCQSDPACGGWQPVDAGALLQMCVDYATTKLGWKTKGNEAAFEEDISACLRGNQPDMKKYSEDIELVNFIVKIRTSTLGGAPWMRDGLPLTIDGRCYIESYENDWNSYLASARTQQTSVSNYQWRAAGEWFAENYAFSWRNQAPPPNRHPDIDGYMWKPK